MRILYNLLIYILLIPFALYWLIRGISNRAYLDRLGQRIGFGFPKIDGCIWVHAVSVGEVQAAVPLIHALIERFPNQNLLVTTVTPTGASRVPALFGDQVKRGYMPVECPHAIRRFVAWGRPPGCMRMGKG